MRSSKLLTGLLMIVLMLGSVSAQMIPSGKLTGTVTDGSKLVLPGVTVKISSPSLMVPELSGITNESGLFRLVSLPPGTYKVTFELQGFKTIVREGIIVQSNETVTLNMQMDQGEISESVLVVGQSPTVDIEKTQLGTTFTQELLTAIPMTRELSSVFNSAPGMFDRTSFGSDARSNNFVVDGVKMQDPMTGDPYQTVPWNAIDEVEVSTSNQKAQNGNVKGAMVSVITKSGGNEFSGGVNFYFRNKSLQSNNTDGTPLEGQFNGFKYQYTPGFSFGGPIKKDKIWFFTSLDVDRSASYTNGFPAPAVAGDPVVNAPIHANTFAPFAKLTFQLDKKNKITASAYYRDYELDHRDANAWTVLDATTREDTAVNVATIQWTNITNDNFFFDLKASWYSLHQYLLANNDLAPLTDYTTDSINYGGAGSDWWYKRRRAEFSGDATYFLDNTLGRHEFKAGVNSEFAFDNTECAYYTNPNLVGAFSDGFKAVDVELVDGLPAWAWVGTEYAQKNNLIQIGAFLQDTWTPIKRLVLSLGLRYDYSQGAYPPQRSLATGEWVNESRINAMSFNMFSPRIGLTFDLTGDGKTVLRANWGRYYAPMLMLYYYFNNPSQRSSFTAHLNSDWSVDYTTPVVSPGTTTVDPNLKSPYADEVTFGIERELVEDFSASATFIGKWERNLIDDVDRAHLDWDTYLATGELVWTGYTAVTGTDPFTGQDVTFYEMNEDFGDYGFVFQNVPGTARKYIGAEFKLTKRMSNRWSMLASYVWSHGTGILNTSRAQSTGFTGFYDDPNSMINAYGKLDYQREHLVKIQGTYVGPWGLNFSAYYQFGSGIPYTRIIRSYEAGLGYLYQGLVSIYAEKRGSENLPAQHLLDLRIQKDIKLPKGELGIVFDCYNAFNNNKATSVGATTNYDYTTTYQAVYGIMSPRYVQLGLIYKF